MDKAAAAARVAANVRAELAREGVSQQTVAALLGCSQQAVSRRLTGAVPFDVAEVTEIADLLVMPVSWLLEGRSAGAA